LRGVYIGMAPTGACKFDRGYNFLASDKHGDAIVTISGTLPGDRVVRRHRKRTIHLKRVLGVSGLFSMVYANVGSSIYYALGVTAIFALGATPLVFLVAGVLFVFTALSYVEGTSMLPEAGGASSFARHGLNEFWSFFAGWAQMLAYIATVSISAYTAIGYLSYFYPVLDLRQNHVGATVILLVLLALLNVRGAKESSQFNVIITIFDLLTQVILVVMGLIFLFNLPLLIKQIHWGIAPTWPNLFFSISIVMVAFTGIETVSNLAEEARDPVRTVPQSIFLTIPVVLLMYIGISSVALCAMPVHQVNGLWTTDLATRWLDDPVAGIAHHLPVGSKLMTAWVAFLATTILVIGTNAGLMGISRLSYAMGSYRQLPAGLSRIHRRFRTPYMAILVFTLVAIILVLPADITKLADAYNFGAMMSYCLASISIIAMRWRKPDLERPYRLKPNITIKGREIPVTAILGALSTFVVWLMVAATHYYGRLIGVPFLLIGILLYIGYRKTNHYPIFKTVGGPSHGKSGAANKPVRPAKPAAPRPDGV